MKARRVEGLEPEAPLRDSAALIVRTRLGELRGKALGCWRSPAACHVDVLVQEV